ncbi:acyl-CoA N-acyltransferase [Biscogniauxia sp. FL1348]|nr:acyl-CoA N-acyltransferase [Biscogniauxia sp. FL1348]
MALPFPHPTLPPGFAMSRVTPADAPGMADVYMEAFSNSEYTYWWSPSAEAMRAWNEERIRRRLRDPATHMFKIVDSTSSSSSSSSSSTSPSQNIVAWAKWDLPASMVAAGSLRDGFVLYDDDNDGERASKALSMPAPPDGTNAPLMNEFFDGIKRMGEKWGSSGKLCLTHLCTRPAYHGRGLGSALLRAVLDATEAAGVPAYLEALRRARPLYERHGFEAVDRLAFRGGAAVVDIMVRAGGEVAQRR